MRKFLVGLLLLPSLLLSGEYTIVGRITYLRSMSGIFQQIYGKGGFAYGGEINGWWGGPWEAYLSLDEFSKRGRSINGGEKTTVRLYPLNVGMKYYINFKSLHFYIGGGPMLLGLRVKNETNLVQQKISKEDLGVTAKLGTSFFLKEALFDFFIEYSYQRMRFPPAGPDIIVHPIDLSHIKVGGALGVRF